MLIIRASMYGYVEKKIGFPLICPFFLSDGASVYQSIKLIDVT